MSDHDIFPGAARPVSSSFIFHRKKSDEKPSEQSQQSEQAENEGAGPPQESQRDQIISILSGPQPHPLWGDQLSNAARYFAEAIDTGKILLTNRTVLELGCGLGLPTIVAALNGARLAVATDLDEDILLKTAKDNMNNAVEVDASKAEDEQRYMVKPLNWGNKDQMRHALSFTGGNGFDVLLLADLLCVGPQCFDELLQTVSRCLSRDKGARAYVAFSHHVTSRTAEDLQFFELAPHYGLQVSPFDERSDFPVMFPDCNEMGPAEKRTPVHCFSLRHVFDEAGPPLDSDTYDVVIQGTGLTESLISAACARSRLKVLHLDPNEHYGGVFSTFAVEELEKFVRNDASPIDVSRCVFERPYLGPSSEALEGQQEEQSDETKEWTKRSDKLLAQRHNGFALDLIPLQFLTRSSLIDSIIGCQMSQHVELQHVQRVVKVLPPVASDSTSSEGPQSSVSLVPLNRAAVFKTGNLGPLEMRRLMKFVNDQVGAADEHSAMRSADAKVASDKIPESAMKARTGAKTSHQTFAELCEKKYQLSEKVRKFLSVDDLLIDSCNTEAEKGLETMRCFLTSVGRFDGCSPYMVSMYGAAELGQIMCRMTAIWEGIFVLRRHVRSVGSGENCDASSSAATAKRPIAPRAAGVTTSNGQKVRTRCVVLPRTCVAQEAQSGMKLSRLILLLRQPFVTWDALGKQCGDTADDEEERTLRESMPEPIVVGSCSVRKADGSMVTAALLQLVSASSHAPLGHVTLHLTVNASAISCEELLACVKSQFFPQENSWRNSVLYAAAFEIDEARFSTNDGKLRMEPTEDELNFCRTAETGYADPASSPAHQLHVLPVKTLVPGLNDGDYADEAIRAFRYIQRLCKGDAGDHAPFLVEPSSEEDDDDEAAEGGASAPSQDANAAADDDDAKLLGVQ